MRLAGLEALYRGPERIACVGARKDVYRVGPELDASAEVEIAIRFREFLGSYVEHCHNTQHEDHAMLLRWDIVNPGQTIAIPTPEGGWEGMFYEPTYVLPTWRTGVVNRN